MIDDYKCPCVLVQEVYVFVCMHVIHWEFCLFAQNTFIQSGEVL